MKVDVIVTRHKALVRYLQKNGVDVSNAKVIEHATPSDIKDKVVAGILPYQLACLCKKIIYVPLNIPRHKRGTELNIHELEMYNKDGIKVYEVKEYDIPISNQK